MSDLQLSVTDTHVFNGIGQASTTTSEIPPRTTIVLLHGYPLDSTLWDDCLDLLADSYRVIAVDLRGFGKSAPSVDWNQKFATDEYTMAILADDVAFTLKQLDINEPVVLGGLSMGGYVAFEFWRRHVDKLKALMLFDTRAIADSEEAAHKRFDSASLALEKGTQAAVEPMIEKLLAPVHAHGGNGILDRLKEMMFRVPATTVAAVQKAMAVRHDMSQLLEEIDMPTLVCVGELDAISPPKEMKEFASKINKATFKTISASGHLTPMENPSELVTAIQEFCRRI